MDNNYIYATILSTENYVPGVIKLKKSLKSTHPIYSFVCFCSTNITHRVIKILEKNNIKCIRFNRSAIENPEELEQTKELAHWRYTFDKLLLFGQTQYKKIVFLDSDMMVLENIDELFSNKAFSAVAAGKLVNPSWNRLNSGIIVIEPNIDIMNKLLSSINKVYIERLKNGLTTGDQDIINEFVPSWPTMHELNLSESYNLFFKNIDLYHKKYGFKYFNPVSGKSIKIVHFIGNKKPWNHSLLKRLILIIKYFVTFDYRLKAYIKYLWY